MTSTGRTIVAYRMRRVAVLALLAASAVSAAAQDRRILTGERIKRYADGVLSLMAYTVAPDVTTSSLSITDAGTSNPDLSMTQFGGGFVVSDTTRLYLEGNAAWSRYDPRFVVSDGQQDSEVPVKWNTVSVTGGIGWDFPVGSKWSIRPIFNFTYGDVASDIKLGRAAIAISNNRELDFLSDGQVALVMNTPRGKGARTDEGKIRAAAVQAGVPCLTTIEAVFAAWGDYAVWQDDLTEIGFWNPETESFSEFYEVKRNNGAFYFRSIPKLTRRVIRHGNHTIVF